MSARRSALSATRASALRRGVSLVELLVGTAIGLFVAAAASMLVATQLSENRRLVLETQLQQDLRATSDIITRELRRVGSVYDAFKNVDLQGQPAQANALNTMTLVSPDPAEITFRYERRLGEQGPYGFRLNGNTIQSQVRVMLAWQDLTDPLVMEVTRFAITAVAAPDIVIPCPKLCAGNTVTCWPKIKVNDLTITIEAKAVADPTVKRELRSRVRLRNDMLTFDPTNPVTAPACPA